MYGLKRRCIELHITDIRLQCSLFDTLVRPMLSYCCEAWAVEAELKDLQQLESLHIEFLRSILGLSKHGTPHYIILAEFGCYLLRVFWWKQILSYLQRFEDLPTSRLFKPMRTSLGRAGKSWVHHVYEWLFKR